MAMLYTMKRNEGKRTGGFNLLLHGVVLLLAVLPVTGWAQAPSFRWAMEGVGSGGYDAANGAAVDAAGNVFVTGGIASSNLALAGRFLRVLHVQQPCFSSVPVFYHQAGCFRECALGQTGGSK